MGALVVDMQRRNDSFGDYACCGIGRRPTVDLFILRLKINCTCSGRPKSIFSPDDLLKKSSAPAHCLVPDLSEGKTPPAICLDRSGKPARRSWALKGCGSWRSHLRKKGFDLLLVETVADALCSWQVLTPRDPIVQCFIFNTPGDQADTSDTRGR